MCDTNLQKEKEDAHRNLKHLSSNDNSFWTKQEKRPKHKILKYTYSKATGKLTYTNNLCSYISTNNVSKMADHYWAHFNAPSTCNPHGLMHGSGTCQEAIANGGSIGNGKLGETQIIVSGNNIVIDTKVKDGEILNNSIQLQ